MGFLSTGGFFQRMLSYLINKKEKEKNPFEESIRACYIHIYIHTYVHTYIHTLSSHLQTGVKKSLQKSHLQHRPKCH